MPGQPDCGTNYVANNGSGTIGFGLIASGDGLFTQRPLKHGDILDGLSNTAAFSESILGNGQVPASASAADPRLVVLEVPGGGDTTPAACEGATGVFCGKRGAKWLDGHYGNTLYNHYYPPNPPNGGTAATAATTRGSRPRGVTTRAA